MLSPETTVRLAIFTAVFVVIASWELVAQRRHLRCARPGRWFANLAIVALDVLAVRIVLPLGLAGVALLAEQSGWGLFNRFPVPAGVSIVASVVVLDLAVYVQHVAFHSVPLLWRLHMVHHADLDYDLTTGLRFHPLETLVSMLLKVGVVLLLGAPAVATVIFEVLLNACSIFNHANVSLPRALERPVRWLLVTPDMHRVHHSAARDETNSNFGFCVPWWDRLFRTYTPQPRLGHDGMCIGLRQFQERKNQSLPWLLALPFRGEEGDYAIRRRRSAPP